MTSGEGRRTAPAGGEDGAQAPAQAAHADGHRTGVAHGGSDGTGNEPARDRQASGGQAAHATAAPVSQLIDACIHCGLCLPACPTYDITGSELDSPRGRIDLVRGLVASGTGSGEASAGHRTDPAVVAHHLDRCLGCRACETACPSGVRYGAILEEGRAILRDAGAAAPSPAAPLLAAFASPAATVAMLRATWLARRLGLVQIGRRFGGAAGRLARLAPDPEWAPWSSTVPRVMLATSARRGAVALLPGCVMDQAFGGVHAAAAALLRAAGFDVHVPEGPLCCGALHAHVGDRATAAALGERLSAAIPGECDALLVDAAGCGSHLKEAPGTWRSRTFDVIEWLDSHPATPAAGERRGSGAAAACRDPVAAAPLGGPVPPPGVRVSGRRTRVAYQDPCHLRHGQGIYAAPRRLLAACPDIEVVGLGEPDRCCGSAGVYNITQPEISDELLRRKIELIRAAQPDVLASANPGCMIQLASGLKSAGMNVPVMHVLEVLASAAFPPHPR